MVAWNPDVPNPNDNTPKWGRDSQPISTPQANKTLETLFSGIGDVFEIGVKGLDQAVKNSIDQEVYSAVDAERNAYTQTLEAATAAASAAPGAGKPLDITAPNGDAKVPANIDRTLGYLGSIKSGLEAGKVNDTYYKGRVLAITKDLRATYPGYRPYIDAKVSSITGFDPANALINDLITDINTLGTGKKSQAEIQRAKLMDNARELATQGVDGAGQLYVGLSNQSIDNDHAIMRIESMNKTKYQVDVAERNWKLVKTQDEQGKHIAQQSFSERIGAMVTNTTEAIQDATGTYTIPQIQNRIRDWQTGKATYKPEEVTAMSNLVWNKINEIEKNAWDIAREKNPQGMTRETMLGSETVQKEIDGKTSYLKSIAANLTKERLPMAMAAAQEVSDMKSAATRAAMNDPKIRPYAERMAGLEGVLGASSPFMVKIAEQSVTQEILPEIRTFLRATREQAVQQDGNRNPYGVVTAKETIEKAEAAQIPTATTAAEMLKWSADIVDPTVPDTAKRGYARFFFDPKNIGLISKFSQDAIDKDGNPKPGQNSIYNSLTSSRVTEEIFRVTKDSPQLRDQYVNWARQTFGQELFNTDLQDLSGWKVPQGVSITYNDKTYKFDIISGGRSILNEANLAPVAGAAAEERARATLPGGPARVPVGATGFDSAAVESIQRAQASLRRINQGLENNANISKQLGQDPNTFNFNLMVAAGYRPTTGTNLINFPEYMFRALMVNPQVAKEGLQRLQGR